MPSGGRGPGPSRRRTTARRSDPGTFATTYHLGASRATPLVHIPFTGLPAWSTPAMPVPARRSTGRTHISLHRPGSGARKIRFVPPFRLVVNGAPRDVDAPAEMPLLWVLRDRLGLTGTKYGRGVGICGACTIHLDGRAARDRK